MSIRVGGGKTIVRSFIGTFGGAKLAGSAVNSLVVAVKTGIRCGGDATYSSIYEDIVPGNKYYFICNGQNNVPAETNHDLVALAYFRIAGNTLFWNIEHAIPGIDTVRLRGPANRTENGVTQIDIGVLQSLTSPIIGSASVTADQKLDILNGLWYVLLRNEIPERNLRGQLETSTGLIVGGTSLTGENELPILGSGGAVLSPKSIYGRFYDEIPSGGLSLSGTSPAMDAPFLEGGIKLGGLVSPAKFFDFITSGGIHVNGLAKEDTDFNPKPLGGVKVSGFILTGIGQGVSGGIELSGTDTQTHILQTGVSGGVKLKPLHTSNGNVYAAQPIKGGVRVGGKVRLELIKPVLPKQIIRGVGAALKSSNILKKKPTEAERILDPFKATQIKLDENRHKQYHNADWINFGEEKTDTSGYVSSIINKRQRNIMPEKKSRKLDRSRQIATLN